MHVALKYIKQNLTEIQIKIDNPQSDWEILYILFLIIIRTSRQKDNSIENLNNMINKFDLLDICITLYPAPTKYILFSTQGPFFKNYQMLHYKVNLNEFKW